MRLAFRISLLVIALAASLSGGATSAGTLVEFPNLPGHTPTNLSGYLARPDSGLSAELGGPSNGGTPYPAVVLLHGCNGMFGHSAVIADRLSSWGYVTRAVDSLGRRVSGIANRCGRGLPDQVFDAYAALRYLSQLDFVDRARVASSANRWAAKRRSTPWTTTRSRNFSKSGFVRRSPITPTATSRPQR